MPSKPNKSTKSKRTPSSGKTDPKLKAHARKMVKEMLRSLDSQIEEQNS